MPAKAAGMETLQMQIQTISDMLTDLNAKYNKDGEPGRPKMQKSRSKSKSPPPRQDSTVKRSAKSPSPDKPAAADNTAVRAEPPKEEQMLKRKIKSIKIKRRVTRNKQTTTIRTMEENRTMRRNYRRSKNSRLAGGSLESKTQRFADDSAEKPPFLAGRAPPNRVK